MKKERLINLGLALLVLAVIVLLAASQTFAAITDTIIGIVTLTLMIGLSIYKVALWFRYRNDPEKREQVVYSFQGLPKEFRRWYLGESKAKEKQR
jgi:uncharacterized membrane-anchored protein